MTEQLREIKKLLSSRLKKDRYEHTIGVMYTAAALAMNYGEEIQAALTAGLLMTAENTALRKNRSSFAGRRILLFLMRKNRCLHWFMQSLEFILQNMSTESPIRVSLMRSDGIPPDVLT